MGGKILKIIEKHMENMNGQLDGMKVRYGEIMQDLEAEKEAILLRIKYGEQEAAIRQRIKDLSHLATTPQQKKDLEIAIRQIAALEKQEEAVKRLKALYKSLGQTIEDGLVNAIEAAINGTKTLGEVARSVFRELQRSLIRYSVNSLMRGLFSFNPGAGPDGFSRTDFMSGGYTAQQANVVQSGGFLETTIDGSNADGGPVRGGGTYLVGERGPELFSPSVSGMITPNHMLGGSTNIVVNVDASGSSVEGDEQSGRELGRMISVAIQSELIKQKRPGGLLV